MQLLQSQYMIILSCTPKSSLGCFLMDLGIGNERGFKKVSDKARKKSLLMYHDKRFQLEPMFPLVAINHEQIKGSTTGGYLLAKKSNFPKISQCLLKLNRGVMSDLL